MLRSAPTRPYLSLEPEKLERPYQIRETGQRPGIAVSKTGVGYAVCRALRDRCTEAPFRASARSASFDKRDLRDKRSESLDRVGLAWRAIHRARWLRPIPPRHRKLLQLYQSCPIET